MLKTLRNNILLVSKKKKNRLFLLKKVLVLENESVPSINGKSQQHMNATSTAYANLSATTTDMPTNADGGNLTVKFSFLLYIFKSVQA